MGLSDPFFVIGHHRLRQQMREHPLRRKHDKRKHGEGRQRHGDMRLPPRHALLHLFRRQRQAVKEEHHGDAVRRHPLPLREAAGASPGAGQIKATPTARSRKTMNQLTFGSFTGLSLSGTARRREATQSRSALARPKRQKPRTRCLATGTPCAGASISETEASRS